MKLSEKIHDCIGDIFEWEADAAHLEAENEELRELFVYFFGENYKELAKG